MGKKLYVGNLPFSVTEEAVTDLFRSCGTVETVTLITDRDTGASKGFGFVEMVSDAEAQAAIDALNGSDFAGRRLKVNEAKGGGRGGGGRGGYGGGTRSDPSPSADAVESADTEQVSETSGGGGTGGNDW